MIFPAQLFRHQVRMMMIRPADCRQKTKLFYAPCGRFDHAQYGFDQSCFSDSRIQG